MPESDTHNACRDGEGYLVDPEDWDEAFARRVAAEEGIELNDEYWAILNFMRAWHEEHGITPDIRHLVAYLITLGAADKKSAKARIFELFPYGYVQQACKIAGMRRPRAWSTG